MHVCVEDILFVYLLQLPSCEVVILVSFATFASLHLPPSKMAKNTSCEVANFVTYTAFCHICPVALFPPRNGQNHKLRGCHLVTFDTFAPVHLSPPEMTKNTNTRFFGSFRPSLGEKVRLGESGRIAKMTRMARMTRMATSQVGSNGKWIDKMSSTHTRDHFHTNSYPFGPKLGEFCAVKVHLF